MNSFRQFVWLLAVATGGACAQTPPVFPARNVPATFFGTVVDDPYRALEDVANPGVAAWTKGQADYARRQLDSLPGYGEMRRRVAELDESAPALIANLRRDAKDALYFTRRGPRDNTYKLYRRDAGGAETLLADPDDWQKKTGKPHAINYFEPSPDGRLVAFGVSAAGSEDASIYVIETATRKPVGAPIDRAQYPRISWRPGSRSFFYLRQQEMKPGMPATERYRHSRSWLHVADTPSSADILVAGPDVSPRVRVRPEDFATVRAVRGSRYAVGIVYAGVQREIALYSAPLDSVGKAGTPWTPIADYSDKVTRFAVRGDDIYLLTYRDSNRFSIVRTSLAAPDLKRAATVVAPSERVIVNLEAARDGLYYEARDGAVKRLMRLAWAAASPSEVRLPQEGTALRHRRIGQGRQHRPAAPRAVRRAGGFRGHRGEGQEPRRSAGAAFHHPPPRPQARRIQPDAALWLRLVRVHGGARLPGDAPRVARARRRVRGDERARQQRLRL